jgi:hypothetical protein
VALIALLIACIVSRLASVSLIREVKINSKGWSRILQAEKLLERYCTRTISLWRVVWESVAMNENNESGIDIGREEGAGQPWGGRVGDITTPLDVLYVHKVTSSRRTKAEPGTTTPPIIKGTSRPVSARCLLSKTPILPCKV